MLQEAKRPFIAAIPTKVMFASNNWQVASLVGKCDVPLVTYYLVTSYLGNRTKILPVSVVTNGMGQGDKSHRRTVGECKTPRWERGAAKEEEEEKRKRRKFVSLTKRSIAGRNGRFCPLPNNQSVNCLTPVKFHRFLTFLP